MQKYFRAITLASVVLTIVVNFAATTLPLYGITTAAVSDRYANLFTPAGYVFAIWGLIYLGWLAYAIYPYDRPAERSGWMLPAFPWFVLAAVANMVWLFLWHSQQLGWSVLAMLVLLYSLIMVYDKLEIGVYKASTRTSWMVHHPISLYLGWISVATIANIAAALTQVGWTGLGMSAAAWAGIMIVVAGVLATVALLLRRDWVFAGVVVWALVGIWVKNGRDNSTMALLIGLVVGFLVVLGVRKAVSGK